MSINDMLSVDISLRKGEYSSEESYLVSHLTGDKIEGLVTVRPHCDIRIDGLEVFFIGEERTTVQMGKVHRQFQNIKYDVDESGFPPMNKFKSKQRYRFKFDFEVRDHLPPEACTHAVASPVVRQAHLRPPPSFGDPTVSGLGGKLRDDYAPPTCRIVYTIQVNVLRNIPISDKKSVLMTRTLKLRVKPAIDATPPLDLMSSPNDYCLEQDHAVLDSRSKAPMGQLTVILDPPKSFCLPLRDPHSLVSSTVNMALRYETSEAHPELPQLQSFRGQLVATTFYTVTHHDDLPTKKKDFFNRPKNYSDTQFPPFSYSMASLDWVQVSHTMYETALLVPLTLPRLNFIPTFHTCLVSRIYALELRITVPGAAPFTLKAPVHIYAERDPSALPSYIAAVGFDSP
ncbi:hypothetical protein BDV25DRAFT_155472 [Aspergillus avenaceus]|uniref:Arrestin-like N-terminal domain-containing protein n=1 Tax=Aspergillus avenaceus TaxID=36643 RepID=A0A5N6TU05_ASPAV|nr:hypothetical protein BDV25DRAFT_155472 [Aspergillus avenaceus]